MNDDFVGTASLSARLPAIPHVPEAKPHVNTDFSISKFSKMFIMDPRQFFPGIITSQDPMLDKTLGIAAMIEVTTKRLDCAKSALL